MIKWYWHALRPKNDSRHYFARINEKLSYNNLKKKNWKNQLKISFKSDKYYTSKKAFLKNYYDIEYISYVNYIKKNIHKKKKILSIGSGRGVAEIKLIEEGYNITLSDISYPSGLRVLKKTFRNIKYIKFDMFRDQLKKKYDCIVCFNLIYAFDKKKLNKFFKRTKGILKKNGVLIISPGGSTLNIYKIIYNNFYLPLETFLLYIYFFITKKNLSIFRYLHGYIYSDNEIIKIAKLNNLKLSREIERNNKFTEFKRSKIISLLIKKSSIFKFFFDFLGNKIPFSNFFYFKIEE